MPPALLGAFGLVLSEGQRDDSNFLEAVLDGVRVPRKGKGRPRKRAGKVQKVQLDKGYSHKKCRTVLRRRRIKHQIPERRDPLCACAQVREQRTKKGRAGGRPVVFEKGDYAGRNVVERCILRLKQWRRVATR